MRLVVGLGNPGREYARTRHSVGQRVVLRAAERWGASLDRKSFGALVDRVSWAGEDALLAVLQCFMNESGQPVASLVGFHKLAPPQVIVVHDELELPFGEVVTKVGGGHGGHNGLRDIQRAIGNEFTRVRVGIGRPPVGHDAANYVLGAFSRAEEAGLDAVLDAAVAALDGSMATPSTPRPPVRGGGRARRAPLGALVNPNIFPEGKGVSPWN